MGWFYSKFLFKICIFDEYWNRTGLDLSGASLHEVQTPRDVIYVSQLSRQCETLVTVVEGVAVQNCRINFEILKFGIAQQDGLATVDS